MSLSAVSIDSSLHRCICILCTLQACVGSAPDLLRFTGACRHPTLKQQRTMPQFTSKPGSDAWLCGRFRASSLQVADWFLCSSKSIAYHLRRHLCVTLSRFHIRVCGGHQSYRLTRLNLILRQGILLRLLASDSAAARASCQAEIPPCGNSARRHVTSAWHSWAQLRNVWAEEAVVLIHPHRLPHSASPARSCLLEPRQQQTPRATAVCQHGGGRLRRHQVRAAGQQAGPDAAGEVHGRQHERG
jgi:hypothetical protein